MSLSMQTLLMEGKHGCVVNDSMYSLGPTVPRNVCTKAQCGATVECSCVHQATGLGALSLSLSVCVCVCVSDCFSLDRPR